MKIRKLTILSIFILLIIYSSTFIGSDLTNEKQSKDDFKTPLLADNNSYAFEWYRTWGNSGSNYCNDLVVSGGEAIFIIGTSNSDIYLIKYDRFGTYQWERCYNESNNVYGEAVTIDANLNIYIAGYKQGDDMLLLKYDSSGTFQWARSFNKRTYDRAYAIKTDGYQNIYIAGTTYYSLPDSDALLVKYDHDGNYIWDRVLDIETNDSYYDIDSDMLNYVYLTGNIKTSTSEENIFIAKYDLSGVLQWSYQWGRSGYKELSYGITLDTSTKDIYIAGSSYLSSTLKQQIFFVKFNEYGSIRWFRDWGSEGIDSAYDIVYDSNYIYIGGRSSVNSVGAYDMCVLIYNKTGAVQNYKSWGGTLCDSAMGIALENDNIYLAGITESYGSGLADFGLVKFNPIPKITIYSPISNNFYAKKAPSYNIFIDDNDYIEKYYTLNDGSNIPFTIDKGSIDQTAWNACPNGTVSIKFYVRDPVGTIFKEVIVYKDVIAPNITILSPVSGDVFGNPTIEFNLLIKESNLNSTWYSLNSGENHTFSGTSSKINQTAWDLCGNGTVLIKFYANDTVGNLGCKNITVYKDIYLPFIRINNPLDGQYYGIKPPQYNVSISSITLHFKWYSLNNTKNYTITEDFSTLNQTAWSQFDNGSIIIKFYANNTAGAISSKQVTVFKNVGVPNVTIISPSPDSTFGNRTFDYQITITKSDYDKIWYSLNDGLNYITDDLSGKINQTAWDECISGPIILKFFANNSVGNIGFRQITIQKDSSIVYPKEAFALIVGIENYPGSSYDLYYCRDDALSISSYLQSECNFKNENIVLLLDSAGTYSGINNAFLQIQGKINKEDIFLFYFSGHGGYSGGSQYMCPYDSIPSNPSMRYYDWLLNLQLMLLDASEKYIIIDSCYSGGMIIESTNSGRYYIAACEESELSLETSQLGHGVFTYYFLQSFAQASDSNSDGMISIEDQFSYARSRTISYTSGSQHPDNYDDIPGPGLLYPAIGSVSYTTSGNELNYSFELFGHGSIKSLNITVCSLLPTIEIRTKEIFDNPTSITGFGNYTGSIQFPLSGDITGVEFIAEIEGHDLLTIKSTHGDYDGDGLKDFFEIYEGNGIDPTLNDTDSDYLNDFDEFYGTTNPLINDTDSDGLLDGLEVKKYGTNPLCNDTDGDGYLDGWEVEHGYNPTDPNDPPHNSGTTTPTENKKGPGKDISSSENQSISMGNYYAISFVIGVFILITIRKRKLILKKN